MAYSNFQDQQVALFELSPPSSSMERFQANSSSVYTMSSSLEAGRLSVIYCDDTANGVYFTTDGSDPSDTNYYGTASFGVPVAPGEKFPVYFGHETTGSMTLKFRGSTDSVDVIVYQHPKID